MATKSAGCFLDLRIKASQNVLIEASLSSKFFTCFTRCQSLLAFNIGMLFFLQMSQIINTFRLGSTGQLSIITYLLLWGGAIARVFTTIQETSDPLMLIQYCSTVILNTIIVIQFLIYWSADKKKEQ